MVYLRLGRVYIFRNILITLKGPATKRDHPAGKAMYREHYPAAVTVI